MQSAANECQLLQSLQRFINRFFILSVFLLLSVLPAEQPILWLLRVQVETLSGAIMQSNAANHCNLDHVTDDCVDTHAAVQDDATQTQVVTCL